MEQSRYWLFTWIEHSGWKTLEDARKALGSEQVLDEMRGVAKLWWDSPPEVRSREPQLCAGSGVDLVGEMSCASLDCRFSQIDDLFRHTWHYFDRIILPDGAGQRLLYGDWKRSGDRLVLHLASDIAVALRLRALGAEMLVSHAPKLPPIGNWREHASTADLSILGDAADDLAEWLLYEADFRPVRGPDGRPAFRISHPLLHPNLEFGGFSQDQLSKLSSCSELDRNRVIARSVVSWYMSYFFPDLLSSRLADAPLGTTLPLFQPLLETINRTQTVDQVAFHLELPVLNSVPLETLIRIRNDEQESFQRFRNSLRLAAQERVSATSGKRPEEIAQEIELDLIAPAISKIRDRLAVAQRGLAKKSALGTTLGALTTTCGLLAGTAPGLATTAGIGALLALVGSATSKYVDDKSTIELSDMYFLWQAHQHARSSAVHTFSE